MIQTRRQWRLLPENLEPADRCASSNGKSNMKNSKRDTHPFSSLPSPNSSSPSPNKPQKRFSGLTCLTPGGAQKQVDTHFWGHGTVTPSTRAWP
ncbi:hypothetical protein FSOLCH5_010318 [Fusarium solani]